jgi:hypothetical protein
MQYSFRIGTTGMFCRHYRVRPGAAPLKALASTFGFSAPAVLAGDMQQANIDHGWRWRTARRVKC